MQATRSHRHTPGKDTAERDSQPVGTEKNRWQTGRKSAEMKVVCLYILVNIYFRFARKNASKYEEITVSDYVKPMLWCRHSRACIWNGKPLGKGKGGWGGKGGGGQYTSNLGPGWTGIAPHEKEGFQISKRWSGTGEGFSRQRGITKGIVHVPPI